MKGFIAAVLLVVAGSATAYDLPYHPTPKQLKPWEDPYCSLILGVMYTDGLLDFLMPPCMEWVRR